MFDSNEQSQCRFEITHTNYYLTGMVIRYGGIWFPNFRTSAARFTLAVYHTYYTTVRTALMKHLFNLGSDK